MTEIPSVERSEIRALTAIFVFFFTSCLSATWLTGMRLTDRNDAVINGHLSSDVLRIRNF